MSEQVSVSMDSVDAQTGLDKPTGVGAILRAARQAQGLPIAMLAVSLKVPSSKLEALEADRYDLFPDTVFLRALASGVCRALKIDPNPVLEALPRSNTPKIKTDEDSLNTVFSDASSSSSHSLLSYLRRPIGMAMVLLVAGIVAIIFFPKNPSIENAQLMPVLGDLSSASATKVTPLEGATSELASASSVVLPSATSFGVSEVVGVPVPVEPTSSQKATSQVGLEPKYPLPTASEQQGSNTALLALHAHGTSWVEVLDAKGVMLLRRTLVNGEVVPVSGTRPLTVVIGRADLITAFVRGQALDTTGMSNNNVARFEVK